MYHWPYADPALAPGNAPVHIGGSWDISTLLGAYQKGIFPWPIPGLPIRWWSPDPRFVLLPSELRCTPSLRKVMRKTGWKVTIDQDFASVIRHCAKVPRAGQASTWITPEVIQAYTELHRLGFAHSVETYWEGELVGGLYGITMGQIFHGESMFHLKTDASKVAFVALVERLHACGYRLIDCQIPTPHLASFGAFAAPRSDFLAFLEIYRKVNPKGNPWVNPLWPKVQGEPAQT